MDEVPSQTRLTGPLRPVGLLPGIVLRPRPRQRHKTSRLAQVVSPPLVVHVEPEDTSTPSPMLLRRKSVPWDQAGDSDGRATPDRKGERSDDRVNVKRVSPILLGKLTSNIRPGPTQNEQGHRKTRSHRDYTTSSKSVRTPRVQRYTRSPVPADLPRETRMCLFLFVRIDLRRIRRPQAL